jgi:hypothetical protein
MNQLLLLAMLAISEPTVNSMLIASFGIVLAAALTYFVRINAKMNDQAVEIATLKTQVSPLWAQVQARIAADLHHPHPRYFEMDGLLEKLEALTITPDERARLKALLNERAHDMHPEINADQRKKAAFMIQVMDLVLVEAKETKADETLDKNLENLAEQTLRNVERAKTAATIVVEQVQKQVENKKEKQ